MATAAIEPQAEQKAALKKTLASIRTKIEAAQTDERGWREKLDSRIAALGDLRKRYDAECHAVAIGRDGDPQGSREEVSAAEGVVEAVKKIIAEKQGVLEQLRQQLSIAQNAFNEIEQREAEAQECRAIQENFEQGKRAIAARDEHQAELYRIVSELRHGSYISQANQRNGKNLAMSLERLSNGIIT
jgi:hypothetical protein